MPSNSFGTRCRRMDAPIQIMICNLINIFFHEKLLNCCISFTKLNIQGLILALQSYPNRNATTNKTRPILTTFEGFLNKNVASVKHHCKLKTSKFKLGQQVIKIPPSICVWALVIVLDGSPNFNPMIKQNSTLENLILCCPIPNHISKSLSSSIVISLARNYGPQGKIIWYSHQN